MLEASIGVVVTQQESETKQHPHYASSVEGGTCTVCQSEALVHQEAWATDCPVQSVQLIQRRGCLSPVCKKKNGTLAQILDFCVLQSLADFTSSDLPAADSCCRLQPRYGGCG